MYEGGTKNLANQYPLEEPSRHWLDDYDTPQWLIGGRTAFYGNQWRITDDGIGEPSLLNWEYPLYDPITREVTLLTDPKNATQLEIVQRFCIAIRDGHIRRIASAASHRTLTKRVMTIFAWMRLNFVYSLDQLAADHFRHFMKDSTWGASRLLDVENRLNDYLDSLQRSELQFPVQIRASKYHVPKVDVLESYRQMGLDPDLNQVIGRNFNYKFWNAVAQINGPKLVPKHHRHYLEIEEEPDRREPVGIGTIMKYAHAWQTLNDLSYILPQKCNVDPVHDFVKGEQMSLKKIAEEVLAKVDIEIDEGITDTIPDRQAFHILDRACRWVLIYADDLLDLRKRASIESSRPTLWASTRQKRLNALLGCFAPNNFTEEDPGAPWPLISNTRTKISERRNLTIDEATGFYLMAACAIVIAAFTARRKMEVLTIKGGEPTNADPVPRALYIDGHGEPWIWTYIEKTLQRRDRTPIPPVVVKAIEVLEALTESTRKAADSRSLFELENLRDEPGPRFRLMKAINLFADFVGTPLLECGSKWVFKPHQFRRFFSLLYMYRYRYGEAGKMEVLFHQLRHFNMEMTKRYVEEIYESDMLKAHSKNIVVDLMSEVLRGKRKAFGPGGEAMRGHLDEMLHEVIKDSEILSGRENPVVARKIAERVMVKLDIDMVPLKWGFCYAYKAAEGGGFHGNCTDENNKADKPNVARATPKKCLGCPHLYVDENFRIPWELGAKSYRTSADRGCHTDMLTQYALEYAEVYEEGMRTYFGVEPKEVA